MSDDPPDDLLGDDTLIAEAQSICRLTDGSACSGPESDCTPANCFAVRRVWQAAFDRAHPVVEYIPDETPHRGSINIGARSVETPKSLKNGAAEED